MVGIFGLILSIHTAQVEGRLKTQYNKKAKSANDAEQPPAPETVFPTGEPMAMQAGMQQSMPSASYDPIPTNDPIMLPISNMASDMMPAPVFAPQIDLDLDQSFSWEMIGLGLEEPMPTQEAVDELYELHFPISIFANKTKNRDLFR